MSILNNIPPKLSLFEQIKMFVNGQKRYRLYFLPLEFSKQGRIKNLPIFVTAPFLKEGEFIFIDNVFYKITEIDSDGVIKGFPDVSIVKIDFPKEINNKVYNYANGVIFYA